MYWENVDPMFVLLLYHPWNHQELVLTKPKPRTSGYNSQSKLLFPRKHFSAIVFSLAMEARMNINCGFCIFLEFPPQNFLSSWLRWRVLPELTALCAVQVPWEGLDLTFSTSLPLCCWIHHLAAMHDVTQSVIRKIDDAALPAVKQLGYDTVYTFQVLYLSS